MAGSRARHSPPPEIHLPLASAYRMDGILPHSTGTDEAADTSVTKNFNGHAAVPDPLAHPPRRLLADAGGGLRPALPARRRGARHPLPGSRRAPAPGRPPGLGDTFP